MTTKGTLLKTLLSNAHWQPYARFCRQWDLTAARAEPDMVGGHPSRSQYARWLSGDVRTKPRPGACVVLEAMFPGYRTAQLLELVAAGASVATLDPPAGTAAAARRPEPALGPTSLAEEIAMATEESASFVRAGRGTVDQDVLAQLRDDVDSLAADYLTRAPYAMFTPIAALRSEVFTLIGRRQRPTMLPGLYKVAGRLCALLAHTCADLGHPYPAETHARTAWVCADMGDDPALRAFIRWVQSNIAYWKSDYATAAQLAGDGQQYATGTDLLRLTSQQARAAAAADERADAERALAAAQDARAEIAAAGRLAGVFDFAAGKAAYYASEVRATLGGADNLRRAVTDARDAIDLFTADPATCPEFVAAAHLDLAAAHLAADDLDAATGPCNSVLQLSVESRTVPVVQRARTMDTALAGPRYAGSAVASDLRQRLHLFTAYTATRDLPPA